MNNDLFLEVKEVIERIKPYILQHGGDIELIKVEDGIVQVRMSGNCVGCSFIDNTLIDGLETLLVQQVPGIYAVQEV